jgi:hypothetical protein
MERAKVAKVQMIAVHELNQIETATKFLELLDIEQRSMAASVLKEIFVKGFNLSLQFSASYMNNKKDYDSANEILKIGTELV